MNERTNEQTDEQTNEQKNERINKYVPASGIAYFINIVNFMLW